MTSAKKITKLWDILCLGLELIFLNNSWPNSRRVQETCYTIIWISVAGVIPWVIKAGGLGLHRCWQLLSGTTGIPQCNASLWSVPMCYSVTSARLRTNDPTQAATSTGHQLASGGSSGLQRASVYHQNITPPETGFTQSLKSAWQVSRLIPPLCSITISSAWWIACIESLPLSFSKAFLTRPEKKD